MKCALNDGDLYCHLGGPICRGCVFENDLTSSRCVRIRLCRTGHVIKRSHNQSDIFKI